MVEKNHSQNGGLLTGPWIRSSSPEQKEEAVDFQHHAYDGPADEHHKHTTQEEAGGLHLVLDRKSVV